MDVVSIKLTPFRDRDMPDEILVLSPRLEGRDNDRNPWWAYVPSHYASV